MTSEANTIPEISVDTRLLYERLAKLEKGETVTYTELSAIIGRDVRGPRARHLLDRARKLALENDNVVVEAVVNEGLRRPLDTVVVTTTGECYRRGVIRRAVIAARKYAAVDYGALSEADRVKHNAEVSQLGAIKAFAADSTTKQLEASISGQQYNGPLPIGKMLDVFRSS